MKMRLSAGPCLRPHLIDGGWVSSPGVSIWPLERPPRRWSKRQLSWPIRFYGELPYWDRRFSPRSVLVRFPPLSYPSAWSLFFPSSRGFGRARPMTEVSLRLSRWRACCFFPALPRQRPKTRKPGDVGSFLPASRADWACGSKFPCSFRSCGELPAAVSSSPSSLRAAIRPQTGRHLCFHGALGPAREPRPRFWPH